MNPAAVTDARAGRRLVSRLRPKKSIRTAAGATLAAGLSDLRLAHHDDVSLIQTARNLNVLIACQPGRDRNLRRFALDQHGHDFEVSLRVHRHAWERRARPSAGR